MFDDYYWIVGGDETQVWSSKRTKYVAVSDAEYLSWLNEIDPDSPADEPTKNQPIRILNEQELDEVLNGAGLPSPIVTPAQVYAESKRRKMVAINQTDEVIFDEVYRRGLADGVRLNNKQATGQTLTADERARKAQLEQIEALFETIDEKADALIALNPIPANYKDDIHWQ